MSLVLGICDGHDSGAALVDSEGRVVFAVSEERLSRVKRQAGFPSRAIAAALDFCGGPGEVLQVAVAERGGRLLFRALDPIYRRVGATQDPRSSASRLAERYNRLSSRFLGELEAAGSEALLRRRLHAFGLGGAGLTLVDHHRCHAWSAAAGAGDALVLTMDAYGDGASGGVYRAVPDGSALRLERRRSIPAPHGPAILWATLTAALGFGEGDEGKVVARAAAGDPERLLPAFEATLGLREGLPHLRQPIERLLHACLYAEPEDVAAALQAHTEKLVVRVFRVALERWGGRELALAGGLFANVALNRRLAGVARGAGLERVFVFPAMGDAGLCVGAAFEALARRGGRPAPFRSARLGPEPGGGGGVGADEARRALLEGRVVARCSGRMEFGPRALGARSLLFLPDRVERGAALNAALDRDPRMPFGPVVTEAAAPRLLEGWSPVEAELTRFMTVALPASGELRRLAPAAVHEDGTARAQVLRPDEDPELHDVLASLPGGVAVNTSLNRHGEPIVCTNEEARATAEAVGAVLWT